MTCRITSRMREWQDIVSCFGWFSWPLSVRRGKKKSLIFDLRLFIDLHYFISSFPAIFYLDHSVRVYVRYLARRYRVIRLRLVRRGYRFPTVQTLSSGYHVPPSHTHDISEAGGQSNRAEATAFTSHPRCALSLQSDERSSRRISHLIFLDLFLVYRFVAMQDRHPYQYRSGHPLFCCSSFERSRSNKRSSRRRSSNSSKWWWGW